MDDTGMAEIHSETTWMWNDFRLQWDPVDYRNNTHLTVDSKDIWIPDVHLYNLFLWDAKEKNKMERRRGSQKLANVLSNGLISWTFVDVSNCKMVFCISNNFQIHNIPFSGPKDQMWPICEAKEIQFLYLVRVHM